MRKLRLREFKITYLGLFITWMELQSPVCPSDPLSSVPTR